MDAAGNVIYSRKVTRDGQSETAIPVKVPKDTQWRTKIMEEVVEAVKVGAVPTVEIPTDEHLKLYGKKLPKQPMEDLVEATKARSRFSK
jgi:hypothetical protein